MRFDEYGYPCIQGSSDSEDSSHLAGILVITQYTKSIDTRAYVSDIQEHWLAPIEIRPTSKYIRCKNSKYNFSRDQAWLLMVALLKQGHKEFVKTNLIDGKDFIPPSLKGVETIAKRGKPYFWQYLWAKLEVWIHAKLQPLEEPFQTIAACEAYGLYKFWTDNNKLWRWSIRRYLCELDGAWRNEPELADHVIKYVESRIK